MRTKCIRSLLCFRPIIVQQESFHLFHIKVTQVFGASEQGCCLPGGANHDSKFFQIHLPVAVFVKLR